MHLPPARPGRRQLIIQRCRISLWFYIVFLVAGPIRAVAGRIYGSPCAGSVLLVVEAKVLLVVLLIVLAPSVGTTMRSRDANNQGDCFAQAIGRLINHNADATMTSALSGVKRLGLSCGHSCSEGRPEFFVAVGPRRQETFQCDEISVLDPGLTSLFDQVDRGFLPVADLLFTFLCRLSPVRKVGLIPIGMRSGINRFRGLQRFLFHRRRRVHAAWLLLRQCSRTMSCRMGCFHSLPPAAWSFLLGVAR